MSDAEAALVAMLAMAAAILIVAVAIWTIGAARRRTPPRARAAEPILDLTYFEQAIRRTEEEGRRHAEEQRRNLSERRSTWPEGGGR